MITYLTGDATYPVKTPALIMHICNDIGSWGRGFVLALSKRWPEPANAYRRLKTPVLGTVEFVPCEGDGRNGVIVANMIAQHDISHDSRGSPPIRYDALAACLREVHEWASINRRLTIHAPRIGCGLAGGSWSVVEPLIEFYLKDREVYIYDLPEKM